MVWLTYYVYSFAIIPVAERSPHFIRGFFVCLFVVVLLPVSLGYLLLFKLVPWLARRLNPA
jgi:hypothetical protein